MGNIKPLVPSQEWQKAIPGALGVSEMESAKPGLGLGMVPGQALFIVLVPGAVAGLWQQPEAGGGTQGWSVTARKAGDDGGEIRGGAAAPGQTCWELMGTGRLPGQRQMGREFVCAGRCGGAGGFSGT